MTRLLAVDPGADCGWAYFYDGRLLACGLGCPPDREVERFVIEMPEDRRNSRVRKKDILELAFRAGLVASRWAQVMVRYRPTQWKASVDGDVMVERILALLDGRERALVAGVPCAEGKRHNVVDAVGLGLFALKRMKRGGG